MKLADTPPVDPALARRRAAMTLRYAGEALWYRPSRRRHPTLLARSQAMGGVPEMIPVAGSIVRPGGRPCAVNIDPSVPVVE